MRVVREKFTENKLYAFTTPYYIVDVILNKLYSGICVACKRKTNYTLYFIIDQTFIPQAPNTYINCYCCSVQCMKEEINKLDAQVIEWITT